MYCDYHMHSTHSHDGRATLEEMAEHAIAQGLDEICFTEHLDYDEFENCRPMLNVRAYYMQAMDCREKYRKEITIRIGVEIGLKDEASHAVSQAALAGLDMDFIIGSVHYTRGGHPYDPAYYRGMHNARDAYALYFSHVLERLRTGGYSVMGHYDYPSKGMPFAERAPRYAYCPDAIDAMLRYLVESGIGMEINTSAWFSSKEAAWGGDILARYRALGGEFVTIGSDAHTPYRIGHRFHDALEIARAAGIPYLATFHHMRPTLHKI